jgi:hypothetical protein
MPVERTDDREIAKAAVRRDEMSEAIGDGITG